MRGILALALCLSLVACEMTEPADEDADAAPVGCTCINEIVRVEQSLGQSVRDLELRVEALEELVGTP